MTSTLRALARRLLGLLPSGVALPILRGPARGVRWIVGSSNPTCWTGSFERDTQRFLVSCLKRGDRFVDIGAHAGFFTLLGARLVGENGRVLAVEPLAANVDHLERHLRLNRLGNVRCLQAALSDFEGTASLGFAGSTSCARLGVDGEEVPVTTLDAALASWAEGPVRLVKMDVEGEEARVLAGGQALLSQSPRPALCIATHGWRAHASTVECLREAGYEDLQAEIDDVSGNGTVRFSGSGWP